MKYIIFDLDGTLIDSMPVWKNVGKDYLSQYGFEITQKIDDRIKRQTLPETALCFKELFHIPQTVDEIVTEIIAMVAEQYANVVPLKPFVKEYLEKEKQNGTKMCILTASEPNYILAAMERLSILPYFDFIATCTEMGLSKKDPQVFIETMQRLGGTMQNTMVFEDALYAIRSAKKGGFYVVAVAEKTRPADFEEIQQLADNYIYSYEELL